MEQEKKTIFFVCPIGDKESDIRKNSDAVFRVIEHIIKNNEEFSGRDVVRADKIASAGRITMQIYHQLRTSDICIVDLTGLNPNVLYELGIRQALLKPYVLIAKKGTTLPFDLHDARTFFYETSDINWVFELEDKLKGPLLTAVRGKIDEFDEKLFGHQDTFLSISENDFNLRLMETLNDVISAERRTSGNVEELLNHFKTLSNQFSLNYNKIETLFESSYKGTGTYLFINGENEAFSALTSALSRAKTTIRTTRFSPFDVGSRQKEFANMIQNRIIGDSKYKPVTNFYRIIAANDMSKLKDIENYLDNYIGRQFTLYLTPYHNNFELVIIDESEVFIHFHDKDKIIDSTLHIVKEEVVKKFINIYSSLHDPALYSNVRRYDFKYITNTGIPGVREEIKAYFENHCNKNGVSINGDCDVKRVN